MAPPLLLSLFSLVFHKAQFLIHFFIFYMSMVSLNFPFHSIATSSSMHMLTTYLYSNLLTPHMIFITSNLTSLVSPPGTLLIFFSISPLNVNICFSNALTPLLLILSLLCLSLTFLLIVFISLSILVFFLLLLFLFPCTFLTFVKSPVR